MFDSYLPTGIDTCPACGADLGGEEWQGKDGPCCLLTFRQGEVAADSTVEDTVVLGPGGIDRNLDQLPQRFRIYLVHDAEVSHWIDAQGELDDEGRWAETTILGVTELNRPPRQK